MITEKEITLFDDYITANLSDEENKLASDPRYKSKFERYKQDFEEISDAAELKDFRNQIKGIHQNLYPKKKVFFLQPKVLIPLSIAAILIVGVFIIPNTFFNSEGAAYNELSYAEDSNADQVMMEMEEATEEEYFEEDYLMEIEPTYNVGDTQTPSFIPRQPKGTAFMFDPSGYFITSKHLLDGADQMILQHRIDTITFFADVIFEDSLLDMAILKAPDSLFEDFQRIPFRFYKNELELGEEVFTLGYTKREIVYTKGDVSSESGYQSDENYIEISMPSNPGNSGAPLFNEKGELVGVITANNSKKQSVTYSINHIILRDRLETLVKQDFEFSISSTKPSQYKYRKTLIKKLKPYIFEVH